MFCPKCGTQNPTTGKFCRSCGTDLAPVSDALAGASGNKKQKFGMIEPIQPMSFSCDSSKPATWENTTATIVTGLAFLFIAFGLAISGRAGGWWFWMLIPAFSILGSGVAQYVQLKKSEQKAAAFPPQSASHEIHSAPAAGSALPPTRADYVRPPQTSIYDTGELVAPPSVTEGTTRQLEINSEGETMTLPKK